MPEMQPRCRSAAPLRRAGSGGDAPSRVRGGRWSRAAAGSPEYSGCSAGERNGRHDGRASPRARAGRRGCRRARPRVRTVTANWHGWACRLPDDRTRPPPVCRTRRPHAPGRYPRRPARPSAGSAPPHRAGSAGRMPKRHRQSRRPALPPARHAPVRQLQVDGLEPVHVHPVRQRYFAASRLPVLRLLSRRAGARAQASEKERRKLIDENRPGCDGRGFRTFR